MQVNLSDIFEFFQDAGKLFSYLANVLKPNGRVVYWVLFEEPNTYKPFHNLAESPELFKLDRAAVFYKSFNILSLNDK